MRTHLSRRLLLVALGATISLVACSSPSPQRTPTAPPISAERAKQLAVDHFNEKFAGLLNLRDAITDRCAALPSIRAEHITSTKLENDVWILQREVLVGLAFSLRVAKDGSWSAVEHVAFYAE
jgi:hypothetical protein